LIRALWLGAGAFILIVAPAIFAAAGNPATAASVVGAVLTRWHYIALGAPVLLLILEWRRARSIVIRIMFVAVLFATAQAMLDLRIRTIRMQSPVPISSLAPGDPVRRHFGILHGVSSLLLVAQVIAAALAAMLDD
jgi:hypothetical protein